MTTLEKLDVDLRGVGLVLSTRRMAVPPYQRLYAWTEDHAEALFKDLSDAIRNKDSDYFLGTIVITKEPTGGQWVIDGQQRLTTTSILLAAIRDYFLSAGDEERANLIQQDYLSKKDFETLEDTPYLRLSDIDHNFYLSRVLAKPCPARESIAAETPSQVLLEKAAVAAKAYIARQSSTTNDPSKLLLDWVKYIRERAKVIVVEVANESNAFTIFEVLNDRGLDLTVADLLKNYLFKHADDRIGEAQAAWIGTTSVLEELGEKHALKTFIRHVWSSKHGLTREKELYEAIRKQITSKAASITFMKELEQKAKFYSALRNPGHELWKEYGNNVVQAIDALDTLRMVQIRPLLISVFSHFEKEEVKKTLPMLVSWTVRFMIDGSTGGGPLEDNYSRRAKDVTDGKIKTAATLYEAMKHIVPSDEQFRLKFERAFAPSPPVTRYYLRTLNSVLASENEHMVNPSEERVNLEHILPQSPSPEWAHFGDGERDTYAKRIGNLTLLDRKLNEKAGNVSFADKKKVFQQSKICMTNLVCDYEDWTAASIDDRQRKLAETALKAWKAKPSS